MLKYANCHSATQQPPDLTLFEVPLSVRLGSLYCISCVLSLMCTYQSLLAGSYIIDVTQRLSVASFATHIFNTSSPVQHEREGQGVV